MTPAWLLDAVAALMLTVAVISAARLVAVGPAVAGPATAGPMAARSGRQRVVASDTDAAHLLMAVAMAGMLAPGLRTLPDTAWEVIFGLLAAWFAAKVARDARANGVRALAGGHCAPHLAHSCAMVYMFLAMTATAAGTGAMSGMPRDAGPALASLRYPTLGLVFAFILVGYSIWDLDKLSGHRYSLETPRVSLAGVASLGVPGPGLLVRASAEPGPAALPGLEAPPDSVATSGPEVPRYSAALRDSQTLADSATPHASRPGAAGGEAGRQPGPAGAAPGARDRAGGEVGFLLSPAVTLACRVVMGVAMAFMLFIAI